MGTDQAEADARPYDRVVEAAIDRTGFSLSDAADLVNECYARHRLGPGLPLPTSRRGYPGAHDERILSAIRDLRARGELINRLQVIKKVREDSTIGLRPATEAVDDYWRRCRPEEYE